MEYKANDIIIGTVIAILLLLVLFNYSGADEKQLLESTVYTVNVNYLDGSNEIYYNVLAYGPIYIHDDLTTYNLKILRDNSRIEVKTIRSVTSANTIAKDIIRFTLSPECYDVLNEPVIYI